MSATPSVPRPFSWFVSPVVLFLLATRSGAEPPRIDYNRDIRPILSNNCYQCHGPDEKERKGDLRLDTYEGATEVSVVPGKPGDSSLIARVETREKGELMPPVKSGKKLTAKEIELLRAWVQQGAKYATHWSYVKPVRITPPNAVAFPNPVDAFLAAALQKRGLKFQPEADKYTLARRVALDLTGLPPTWAEVEAFVKDGSANAYETFVDRQLAKPAFGEHWARMWLDLARYADSAGYADDPARTIWAYRDYVIRSFNANKPFDQFTVEQLAGDLLPNATEEQRIATAFHRNTLTNNEGGTSDEEFRTVAVVDRVNTTLTTWMGTSIACAQCHTHKYDPLTQTEFFGLYAFFNNTADADRTDESPVLEIGMTEERKKLRADVDAMKSALDRVVKSYPQQVQPYLKQQADALAKARATIKADTTVPVMTELAGKQRRKTQLQHRGNYLDLGDEVTEHVPAALPPLPKDAPKNRLTLARWIVSEDNPLTARVVANRFWEHVFGSGLVRTSEEFGSQGELPTHPELLDWLATELNRTKWDVKAFLKLLVMSDAYRQSSKVTPALLEADADNRWLSRGPRVRLTAEMVRDQALAVSGLLSSKMYGPSVKPPQPSFGLNAAFGRSMDWTTSTGEDKFRRGIYTEWRRTNPYPSMSTFDAPNRDVCSVRRPRTNTPLQALVTLNDPVYVEASQALARKVVGSGPSPSARAAFAFRQVASRPASEKEVDRVVKLFEETKATYAKDAKKAATMATDPIGPAPKGADVTELAAWTVVANVLLNLDEMLMKR
ncbi:DUF1553 domain-containing protein [Limnoglobus roseus]|uniref:Cytochrome c domain-containing protein n=1 Tax=Limnoglobus roseus TaxID=2598579 RepID=A0A5C1AL33_9BACT|nr:PSD1 and planctomycete cytochrome C domain-containing protein [Limnoglobus roseus]QEL17894.1 hypothetical protein PX52LOC_04906 [Limnoglobus roseus]